MLLATKTAIAVGVAWFLAPHMPGVTQEFPYYAPVGALVSMYPTFMASARTGFQTLAGLALGIMLAAVVLLLGDPNIITISLAVGLGVLLAGVPRLGAGRDYVPMATLLVLIIDGAEGVDAFSIGYAVQMAMGVLVGLAVNETIFPPLTLDVARVRISHGRQVLLGQLEDVAKALVEQWPPEHEAWAARRHQLEDTVSEIRGTVHEAKESHQANPRGMVKSRHLIVSEGFDDLAVLEVITFHIRDLSEVLVAAIWEGSLELSLDVRLREPLSRCLQTIAEVMRAWDEGNETAKVLEEAQESLAVFISVAAVEERHDVPSLAPGIAVALDLQRILAALQQRLTPADPSTTNV
ncbi:aromatic acid exporter family protein [Arthrobacter sp. H35-D1]|nr:aromatic acid exporter family protein [Arthrobacter sp. H35-D1]MDJ0315427.1 aromatic acid exporter family protein [Arthrobacter sp. H35-D1]